MNQTFQPERYPILEYDPDPTAIIEAKGFYDLSDLSQRAVACFFGDQLIQLEEEGQARIVGNLRSEMGPQPIYVLEYGDSELTLFHPGIGAPFAAAMLEELIALGIRQVIACGGCGVLDRDIVPGHLLIPEQALRHEGTSYHYLPPGRTVAADERAVAAIQEVLDESDLPYLRTTTWTTDAFYRETPSLVAARRAEGCLCVEMEAAALFAVAQMRNVVLGQILYAGDDVSGDVWDSRSWHGRHDTRRELIYLAAEACLRIEAE